MAGFSGQLPRKESLDTGQKPFILCARCSSLYTISLVYVAMGNLTKLTTFNSYIYSISYSTMIYTQATKLKKLYRRYFGSSISKNTILSILRQFGVVCFPCKTTVFNLTPEYDYIQQPYKFIIIFIRSLEITKLYRIITLYINFKQNYIYSILITSLHRKFCRLLLNASLYKFSLRTSYNIRFAYYNVYI